MPNKDIDQTPKKRASKAWLKNATLAVGIGAPLGVIGLASPAAADPGLDGASFGLDTDSNGGIPDLGTGATAIRFDIDRATSSFADAGHNWGGGWKDETPTPGEQDELQGLQFAQSGEDPNDMTQDLEDDREPPPNADWYLDENGDIILDGPFGPFGSIRTPQPDVESLPDAQIAGNPDAGRHDRPDLDPTGLKISSVEMLNELLAGSDVYRQTPGTTPPGQQPSTEPTNIELFNQSLPAEASPRPAIEVSELDGRALNSPGDRLRAVPDAKKAYTWPPHRRGQLIHVGPPKPPRNIFKP